jgi:hypothetical protein
MALPLPTLLSQALVAFTIESDNEFEHRMPLGADTVARLRADLEWLAEGLMRGLEPYPDNWRADVRPPRTLPHYPMVLHRGGFPDGS